MVLVRAITILLIMVFSGGSARAAAVRTDPFLTSDVVPEDVSLFVQVTDGAALRRGMGSLPFGTMTRSLLITDEPAGAWSRLARDLGSDEGELFDQLFGRRVTLVLRSVGERTDWALVTEVDPQAGRKILQQLNPIRQLPVASLPVVRIPEHQLLVAHDGSTWVLGPDQAGALFKDVAQRVADPAEHEAPLASRPAIAEGRALGEGRIGIYARHGRVAGGWSVLVCDPSEDQLHVQQYSHFDFPPVQRPMTTLTWNRRALECFEDSAIFAIIEPTDIGGGTAVPYVELMLGQSLLNPKMRQNLGPRQIAVLGEVEGRQEPHETDLMLPVFAIAVEIRDAEDALPQLDAHMIELAKAMQQLGPKPCLLQIPDPAVLTPDATRSVDLHPLVEKMTDEFPLARSISLNWGLARSADGTFYVVASHPHHLRQTVTAIESCEAGRAQLGQWSSCGSLNGRRLGAHLASYAAQPELLAGSNADDAAQFRQMISLVADLTRTVHRCRWQLWRPSELDLRIDVQATLTRAPSAEDDEGRAD